jgi:hypothetical protein
MIKKVLLLLIIYYGLYSGDSYAQWKSDSTTNTPVCTAAKGQQNPQACSDGSNGVIIVWEDYRSGTNWDIYAQKLNADGVPQWTANGINICTSTANQNSPLICSDGSGGAYVVWKDTRTAANGTDLYAQHIVSGDSLGFGASGVGIAVATDGVPPDNLSICSDGSGNAFVAWEDSRTSISSNSRPDIWMNKLTPNGAAWGGASGVSIISQSLRQTTPKLIDDGNGGCYLVWVNGTLPASIWGTRVSGGGSILWASSGIQIFEGATGSSDASRNPSVCRDGSQLCVSWEQLNSSNSTNGWNLLANRFNSDTTFVWGDRTVGTEISTDVQGDQINSIVFSDDSADASSTAGLLVVYDDFSGSHDIVMTRLLPNGSDLKPAYPNQIFSVCRQNNDQTFPKAVKTGSGELLIVWNDSRSNGSTSTYSSIYAQRCDRTTRRFLGPSPSTSSWGLPVSNRVNSNADQVVLVPRTNGGIAVWRDNRNGNTDIYAQLIFRDGSLPVELVNFSVSAKSNGSVLLNWQTASEKDNAGFEIERRMISDPHAPNTFEVVGSYQTSTSLLGAGFSSADRNYSFIDKPGQSGIYEYRLADYSLDGERTVHQAKTVELLSNAGARNGWSLSPNVPNPFSERTMIGFTLAEASQVSVEITNVLGSMVAEPYRNAEMQAGSHQLAMTSSMLGANIPSGTYYCRITARNPQTGEIIWKSMNTEKLSFIRQ